MIEVLWSSYPLAEASRATWEVTLSPTPASQPPKRPPLIRREGRSSEFIAEKEGPTLEMAYPGPTRERTCPRDGLLVEEALEVQDI